MKRSIKHTPQIAAFLAANAALLLPADAGPANAPGSVVAANEGRFEASHYSEPLTAYTVGWRDPENLEAALEFAAPAVQASRKFEFKSLNNDEVFLSESDDVRAIGAAFNRVQYSGSTALGKTLNKGLTIRIDDDERTGDDWQKRAVALLLQRLLRNEYRRAIAAYAAAVSEGAVVWPPLAALEDETVPNPDADLRVLLRTASDDSGMRPNRLLFGEAAWDARAACYEAQATAGGFRSADLSLAELAGKLMVDEVQVAKSRYQSGLTAKSAVLGSSVYAFLATPGLGKDDPSNFKRFWSPCKDGTRFRVYVEERDKYTDITVEHYSIVIVTSTRGLVGLNVATEESE